MANDFYQHSGWPGTRALNASASWRSEFGLIEAGFDKMPDVRTANLFAVTDGSALVGKTVAQAKVLLALENVTNTADADKPISTLTQAALDLKAPLAHTSLTDNPHGVTKAQVGLGDCDNTADAAKPISTLTQSALDLKIPFSYITSSLSASAGRVLMPLASEFYDLLLQWGVVYTHTTPGTGANHSFSVAYDTVLCVVACAFTSATSAIVNYGGMSNTGFQSYSNASAIAVRYFAIGIVTK